MKMPLTSHTVSRRQITVLFCDLVGSTELSQRLDPEDLHETLLAYRQRVQGVAARFGGHHARSIGDGIDIHFGYPQASEDDAVRAVHAGLSIAQEVAALGVAGRAGATLQVRIGIATGWSAVDLRDPGATVGATLNLAARIQSVLEPGMVGVSPATRRVAGGQFVYEDLGAFAFKGFDKPVAVASVVQAATPSSRSAWRWRAAVTPLVGRQAELAWLQATWDQRQGLGHFTALLSAEPGMGKSRLVDTWVRERRLGGTAVLHLQCSSFHVNTPLHPLLAHLRQAAGLTAADDPSAQWRKVRQTLTDTGVSAELEQQVLASFLGLAAVHPAGPPTLPPPAQHQVARDALTRHLHGSLGAPAHGQPTESALMVVEDLHWIDPSSLELLTHLRTGSIEPPLGLLMTTRPQGKLQQLGLHAVSVLEMGALDAASSVALARSCLTSSDEAMGDSARQDALSEAAIEVIAARTDGVPLYIEEMARMLRDEALLKTTADSRSAPQIPDTLMDLLMERLDRLGSAKWLAQAASVMGHQCSLSGLRQLSEWSAQAFEEGLQTLVASGLVQRVGAPLELLAFKHALVADTAYESIPLKLRVSLHSRLADDPSERPWEVSAHHLACAKRHLEAAQAWLEAGRHAVNQGAPHEAAAHLSQGLTALQQHPPGLPRDRVELALLSLLGPTTMVLNGPGSAAFGDIQKQAHALCEALGEAGGDEWGEGLATQRFPIAYGLSLFHWGKAELARAGELAARLRSDAEHPPASAERTMAAHNMSGMVAFHAGQPEAARAHLKRSVGLHEPDAHASLYPIYLMDFGVFGRFYLALSSWVCGEAEAAAGLASEAHQLATQLNQPHSIGFAMLANMVIACWRDDPALSREWAERCIAFSSSHGFPEFVAMARVLRGWATCQLDEDRLEEGLADMVEGSAQWQATGFENWQSWFGVLKAEALRRLGRTEQALAEVERQWARTHELGERQFHSLLLAEQAMCWRAMQRDPAHAQALQQQALELAGAQGAVAWQERVARRWLGEPGRQAQTQARTASPSIAAP
ncbi:MAG: AAA family ATPase [Burkholderiales bacterium]|nr:AAA family ATPase [Burkholderiales bacterium]MBH2017618.1 AAA family ATPase [Burkholderiales bacterium]